MNIAILTRSSQDAGLLSFLWTMFELICQAHKLNRIPIVDMRHNDNGYFHDSTTLHRINPWEYYFKQPGGYSLDEINCPNNDIVHLNFAGFNYLKKLPLNEQQKLSKKYIKFNDDIIESANAFIQQYDKSKILGVCIRGTDYIHAFPIGHHIQPTIDQVVIDIQQYLDKFDIDHIFVSTDESSYLPKLKNIFGHRIINYQHTFVDNHTRQYNCHFLSKTYSLKQITELNKQYLTSFLILCELPYIIMGHTSLTECYKFIRQSNPIYEKIYELGSYPRRQPKGLFLAPNVKIIK